MANLVPLTSIRPVVDDEGKQTQEMRDWTRAVTQMDILIGTGSPEGVVSAVQGQQYMDDAGIAGAIKYIKRDPDIGGDDRFGWILV